MLGMRRLTLALLPVLLLFGGAKAHSTPNQQVQELVQRFEQARHEFDLPAITSMVASDYVEISPLGEVDPHDKMLGYYAPDKKVPAPPMTLDEIEVRTFGDSAAVIARLTYTMAGQSNALRSSYIAHHERGGWKLVHVQYTPLRPGH